MIWKCARVRPIAALWLLVAFGPVHAAVEDRINEAMPLSKAAAYAQSELLRLAAESGKSDQVASEFNAKMRVRAIGCAQGYTPGSFDSKENIAAHFSASDCFQRNDDELIKWIGWRRVGLLVAMPPLRPIPTAVPPLITGTDYIQQVRCASNAGVLLLWTNRAIEALDLGSGKRISHLEGMGGDLVGELSPNGRIVPVSIPGGTSLVDVESGESLARVQSIMPADFTWLGPEHAMIHRRASLSSFVVDFDSGTERPLTFTKESIDHIVSAPNSPDQFIAITGTSLLRIRVDPGHAADPVSLLDLQPFKVQNWQRNEGVLTADHRTYVIAARELNFIATDTLQTTTVAIAPFEVRDVVPMSSPDLILLSGENPGIDRNMGWRRYVYSLTRKSFTPVVRGELDKGRIIYLANVQKLAIVTQNRIAMLDQLPLDAALSNADFLSTMNLEQEQLHAAQAQQNAIPHISGVGPVRVETLPGARVTMQTSGNNWSVSSTPQASDVEGIAVEHAVNVISKPDGSKQGLIVVNVRRRVTGTPLVLLLLSRDSVRWWLHVDKGTSISSIVTAGPGTAEVSGASGVPISHITDAFATQMNSPEYQRLEAEVLRVSGSQISRFQGVPSGSEFTIGGP